MSVKKVLDFLSGAPFDKRRTKKAVAAGSGTSLAWVNQAVRKGLARADHMGVSATGASPPSREEMEFGWRKK